MCPSDTFLIFIVISVVDIQLRKIVRYEKFYEYIIAEEQRNYASQSQRKGHYISTTKNISEGHKSSQLLHCIILKNATKIENT